MHNSQFQNPIPYLESLKGKMIEARLKWGQRYKGILISFDNYMNLQMHQTQEQVRDNYCGDLEEIIIRCNNVLYIREVVE